MAPLERVIGELYKTESAKILAVLTRIFGMHNYALAEDVLQDAFDKALSTWSEQGLPRQPSAWLLSVAKHKALDIIRANKTTTRFAEDLSLYLESEWSLGYTLDMEFGESHIKDDQLRMIFMCCRDDIKPANRLPFILRSLCGFSIPAIMRALMLPEATVKKRLLRVRQKLQSYALELPSPEQLAQRMDSVHTVLYLLFNEGFHSSDEAAPLRLELCQEAIALAHVLIDEPRFVNRDTVGLFALMHFHIARVQARIDGQGLIIPVDLQDRSLWEATYIDTANTLVSLAKSIKPGASGRFYIEACIAKEHCNAKRYEDTNWPRIVELYRDLVAIADSPVSRLNHAVAMAYAGDVRSAIEQVEQLSAGPLLVRSHLPMAVLAHLYAKQGNALKAHDALGRLKERGGTVHEHRAASAQVTRLLAATPSPPASPL